MTSYQHISIEKDGVFHIDDVSDILKSLIREKKDFLFTSIQTATLVSFIINLKPFDFLTTLQLSTSDRTSIYWSDRENKFELFAEGQVDRIYGESNFEIDKVFSQLNLKLKDLPPTVRFYGGFKFNNQTVCSDDWNGFGTYQFVLPHYEVFQSDHQCYFTCNVILHPDGEPEKEIQSELNQDIDFVTKNVTLPHFPQSISNRVDQPDYASWKSLILKSLQNFKDGSLEKIVLARKTSLSYKTAIQPSSFLKHLKEAVVNAFHFYFKFGNSLGFVGASPERLYKREKLNLYTEAIAGTRLRGKTFEEDLVLEQNLLQSDKDIREHDFVCESIKSILDDTCSKVSLKKQRDILKLARVQHLHSQYHGELKPEFSDAELIRELHPTPAVGGVPKKLAMEKIAEYEPFDRGWYAAPLGWISSESSEFAVAIRSGLIDKHDLHVFTGAGIVKGSNPLEEWEEIENKLGSFFVTPSLNGHVECKT